MSKHSIDVNYEREIEIEDDHFVLAAEISIDFEYAGGRFGGDVGFIGCQMRMGRTWQPAPRYIREWAIYWINDLGSDEAIQKAEDDLQPDPDRHWDEHCEDHQPNYQWRDAA